MTKLLARLSAEYNEAMHGYAKGWHFLIAFIAFLAVAWLIRMVLGDPGGGTGDPYYGR